MKIRTDFVTNSSSSSFVTYRLTNSEFCKYLYEQMQKNGFTYEKHSTMWMHSKYSRLFNNFNNILIAVSTNKSLSY